MMLCKNPGAPGGPSEGRVFIPLCGISHGMQGMQKPTVQDIEKINQGGDAPAPEVQNRGAPGAQAVRAPQDYEQVYEVDLKRGDIYVWNGREGRKYKLRKESDAVVEVRSTKCVMLKYYGLYAYLVTKAKAVRISMTRNSIEIHVKNDEQVDDDRIILRSYDKGKIDEITQGTVDAVMARFNIFVRLNLPYIEEECGDCDACVEIEEAKNAKELGIRILSNQPVKTRWI